VKPDMRPRARALGRSRETSSLLWSLAVIGLGLAPALSAFVRLPLPFSPVPLTLQTLFVLLSGALLGAGAGAAAQVVGLVVLWASPTLLAAAAPGGLLGPTGGYLLAFVPAAWLVGWWSHHGRVRPRQTPWSLQGWRGAAARRRWRRGTRGDWDPTCQGRWEAPRIDGWRLFGAMASATGLIYLFGTLQLALVVGLSPKAALWAGVLPFLPGDALKLAAAGGLVRGLRAR